MVNLSGLVEVVLQADWNGFLAGEKVSVDPLRAGTLKKMGPGKAKKAGKSVSKGLRVLPATGSKE